MTSSSDSLDATSFNSDYQCAYEKLRYNKLLLDDKLLLLEKEIATKCETFGKKLVIEPVRPPRRMTQEFFDNAEPLTPVTKKKLSVTKLIDITIADRRSNEDKGKVIDGTESGFSSTMMASTYVPSEGLTRLSSISPEAIIQEKPTLELNIERLSNSHSSKEVSPSNHAREEI